MVSLHRQSQRPGKGPSVCLPSDQPLKVNQAPAVLKAVDPGIGHRAPERTLDRSTESKVARVTVSRRGTSWRDQRVKIFDGWRPCVSCSRPFSRPNTLAKCQGRTLALRRDLGTVGTLRCLAF